MSRHVHKTEAGLEVAFGYDHPLSEYFIEVFDPMNDDKKILEKSTNSLFPENRISRGDFLELLKTYDVATEEQLMNIAADIPI